MSENLRDQDLINFYSQKYMAKPHYKQLLNLSSAQSERMHV
jgi:hypothetical protein